MRITAFPQPVGIVAGHVEVSVEEPPAGSARVTVERTAQRRTFACRGLVDCSVDGDLFVRDYEAPFGVPMTYTARAMDDAGQVIATTVSDPVELKHGRPDTITVHDPVRPKYSVQLTLGKTAISDGNRTQGSDGIRVVGRSLPSLVSGVRGGWASVAFDAVTFTEQQAEQFDRLFGGYDDLLPSGVLCIRPGVGVPALIPRTFFASVPQPNPTFWHPERGKKAIEWALRADEVSPPASVLLEPLVSWSDWEAWLLVNGGWAGFNAAFTSMREANRSLLPFGMGDA